MYHTLQVEDTVEALRMAAAQLLAAAEAKEALDGPDRVVSPHVYDWLDNDNYPFSADGCEEARFVLDLMSRKAAWKATHESMLDMFQLYAIVQGELYRVVMVSSLGDIGITDDLNSDQYNKRVSVDAVSAWKVLVRPRDSVNIRTAFAHCRMVVADMRRKLKEAQAQFGQKSEQAAEAGREYQNARAMLGVIRKNAENEYQKECSKKAAVRELALSHGFKLKEQPHGDLDLNDYVYTFAYALMNKAEEKK